MRVLKFRMWEWNLMKYFDLDDVYYNIVQPSNGVNEPPVMQFTGLFDKNGKEIYEGDILRDTMHDTWFRAWFDGRYKGEFIPHGNIAGGYSMDDLSKANKTFIEVIGNIYENPELLKA